MRGTSTRGFLLVYSLIIVGILALVATLVLASADQAATDARQTETKNESFDAAEAGLNAALDQLDSSLLLNTSSRTATLSNGFHYKYAIYPNFLGTSPQSIQDPAQNILNSLLTTLGGILQILTPGGGGTISIPALGAIIVAAGAGPNGERPTTLEAAVTVDIGSLTYPHYAVLTGLNVQGDYASTFNTGGGNAITLHANQSIRADVGASFQGRGEAGGGTNTLPPGTTHAGQVTLPMVNQFDYMVASMKNQAEFGGGTSDHYVEKGGTLASSYSCSTGLLSPSCVLFYDGPLDLSSGQVTLSGPWTVVVNGNLTLSGAGGIDFQSRPSELIVNGTVDISGTGTTTAYLEAKGGVDLDGSATYSGAILTLGTLTFDDHVGGGFTYDPSVIPPIRPLTGLVKVISYAEY